jgi:hypothetical protein
MKIVRCGAIALTLLLSSLPALALESDGGETRLNQSRGEVQLDQNRGEIKHKPRGEVKAKPARSKKAKREVGEDRTRRPARDVPAPR